MESSTEHDRLTGEEYITVDGRGAAPGSLHEQKLGIHGGRGGRCSGQALAGVAFRPAHPASECLGGASGFRRDGFNRGPLRPALGRSVLHEPDEALADLKEYCLVVPWGQSSQLIGPPTNPAPAPFNQCERSSWVRSGWPRPLLSESRWTNFVVADPPLLITPCL